MPTFRPQMGDYIHPRTAQSQEKQKSCQTIATDREATEARRRESYALLSRAIPVLTEFVEPSPIEIRPIKSHFGLWKYVEIDGSVMQPGWSLGTLSDFNEILCQRNGPGTKEHHLVVSTGENAMRGYFGYALEDRCSNAFVVNVEKRSEAALNERNIICFQPPHIFGAGETTPLDHPNLLRASIGDLLLRSGRDPVQFGFLPPN